MMNRQTQMRKIAGWVLLLLFLFVVALASLKVFYPLPYSTAIDRWASEYSLDPYLIAGLIRAESHFRSDAVSPAGAIGLMQIMPETGAWIAQAIGIEGYSRQELYDSEVNIRLGIWYLSYLVDRFGDIDTALMAYNAGPGNAERWRSSDDGVFAETKQYLQRVKKGERVYRLLYTLPIIGSVVRVLPTDGVTSLRTSP
jgi:soluble lytic murein transglycosylase